MTAREVAEQMKADKAVSDCLQPPVKPTPGPWLLDTTERCYTGKIVRHNGVQICRMIDQVTTDTLEVEANARLIAAAPETAAERDRLKATNADLLAAAEAAVEMLVEYQAFLYANGVLRSPLHQDDVLKATREEIARAKGGAA